MRPVFVAGLLSWPSRAQARPSTLLVRCSPPGAVHLRGGEGIASGAVAQCRQPASAVHAALTSLYNAPHSVARMYPGLRSELQQVTHDI
jgi:hypothetical protein